MPHLPETSLLRDPPHPTTSNRDQHQQRPTPTLSKHALVVGRWQVRSAERLAAEQRVREDERAAREQDRVAPERQAACNHRSKTLMIDWPPHKLFVANP